MIKQPYRYLFATLSEISARPCDGCMHAPRCAKWKLACADFRRYVNCKSERRPHTERYPTRGMYNAIMRNDESVLNDNSNSGIVGTVQESAHAPRIAIDDSDSQSADS